MLGPASTRSKRVTRIRIKASLMRPLVWNVVSGAAQQFAQVRKHVGIGVKTQNAATYRRRRLVARSWTIKRCDRRLLRFVCVEHGRKTRHLQNFPHRLWNVAKLQVSAHLAGRSQSSNYRAQPAAVDESNLAQIQNDRTPVAQQPGHMCAQGIAGIARHNSPVAAHDSYTSYLARIQR